MSRGCVSSSDAFVDSASGVCCSLNSCSQKWDGMSKGEMMQVDVKFAGQHLLFMFLKKA